MELLELLNALEEDLHVIVQNKNNDERSAYCKSCRKVIESYLRVERDGECKCKALTACLQLYTIVRPLCGLGDVEADNLGHFIFLECARLVLEIWYQECEDNSQIKHDFNGAITAVVTNLQGFLIGQLFLVLQWIIVNGWNHPTLSSMLTGNELEEEKALTYLRSGEFPEIIKVRIEILMEQQCEDLALNLCSWCVRSPVFQDDVFVRKTHLQLLYKQGRDDFHDHILRVPCCILVQILSELETDPGSRSALFFICQTALLHIWIHSDQDKACCTQTLLRNFLRLEKEQSKGTDCFLDSANKLLQLSSNNEQRRDLLLVLVDLCSTDCLHFCSEVAIVTLKKDRFLLDTSKIKKEEGEADVATLGLAATCRIIARMFRHHSQMYRASLMAVFYLDPSDQLFTLLRKVLGCAKEVVSIEPTPPAQLSAEIYKEMYCVVDMLRPSHFHPSKSWRELRLTMVLHMLESGFKYDEATNSFFRASANTNSKQPTTAEDSLVVNGTADTGSSGILDSKGNPDVSNSDKNNSHSDKIDKNDKGVIHGDTVQNPPMTSVIDPLTSQVKNAPSLNALDSKGVEMRVSAPERHTEESEAGINRTDGLLLASVGEGISVPNGAVYSEKVRALDEISRSQNDGFDPGGCKTGSVPADLEPVAPGRDNKTDGEMISQADELEKTSQRKCAPLPVISLNNLKQLLRNVSGSKQVAYHDHSTTSSGVTLSTGHHDNSPDGIPIDSDTAKWSVCEPRRNRPGDGSVGCGTAALTRCSEVLPCAVHCINKDSNGERGLRGVVVEPNDGDTRDMCDGGNGPYNQADRDGSDGSISEALKCTVNKRKGFEAPDGISTQIKTHREYTQLKQSPNRVRLARSQDRYVMGQCVVSEELLPQAATYEGIIECKAAEPKNALTESRCGTDQKEINTDRSEEKSATSGTRLYVLDHSDEATETRDESEQRVDVDNSQDTRQQINELGECEPNREINKHKLERKIAGAADRESPFRNESVARHLSVSTRSSYNGVKTRSRLKGKRLFSVPGHSKTRVSPSKNRAKSVDEDTCRNVSTHGEMRNLQESRNSVAGKGWGMSTKPSILESPTFSPQFTLTHTNLKQPQVVQILTKCKPVVEVQRLTASQIKYHQKSNSIQKSNPAVASSPRALLNRLATSKTATASHTLKRTPVIVLNRLPSVQCSDNSNGKPGTAPAAGVDTAKLSFGTFTSCSNKVRLREYTQEDAQSIASVTKVKLIETATGAEEVKADDVINYSDGGESLRSMKDYCVKSPSLRSTDIGEVQNVETGGVAKPGGRKTGDVRYEHLKTDDDRENRGEKKTSEETSIRRIDKVKVDLTEERPEPRDTISLRAKDGTPTPGQAVQNDQTLDEISWAKVWTSLVAKRPCVIKQGGAKADCSKRISTNQSDSDASTSIVPNRAIRKSTHEEDPDRGISDRPDGRVNKVDDHVNQQRGHVNKQDGHYNKQDGHVNKQERHVSKQDGHINKQERHVNKPDDHVNKAHGHVTKQDSHVNKQDGHVSKQERHVTKPDGNVKKQDGHVNKQAHHLNKKDRRINKPDGNVNKQDRHVNKPDGHDTKQDRHVNKHDRHVNKQDCHLNKTDDHVTKQYRFVNKHDGHANKSNSPVNKQHRHVNKQDGPINKHENCSVEPETQVGKSGSCDDEPSSCDGKPDRCAEKTSSCNGKPDSCARKTSSCDGKPDSCAEKPSRPEACADELTCELLNAIHRPTSTLVAVSTSNFAVPGVTLQDTIAGLIEEKRGQLRANVDRLLQQILSKNVFRRVGSQSPGSATPRERLNWILMNTDAADVNAEEAAKVRKLLALDEMIELSIRKTIALASPNRENTVPTVKGNSPEQKEKELPGNCERTGRHAHEICNGTQRDEATTHPSSCSPKSLGRCAEGGTNDGESFQVRLSKNSTRGHTPISANQNNVGLISSNESFPQGVAQVCSNGNHGGMPHQKAAEYDIHGSASHEERRVLTNENKSSADPERQPDNQISYMTEAGKGDLADGATDTLTDSELSQHNVQAHGGEKCSSAQACHWGAVSPSVAKGKRAVGPIPHPSRENEECSKTANTQEILALDKLRAAENVATELDASSSVSNLASPSSVLQETIARMSDEKQRHLSANIDRLLRQILAKDMFRRAEHPSQASGEPRVRLSRILINLDVTEISTEESVKLRKLLTLDELLKTAVREKNALISSDRGEGHSKNQRQEMMTVLADHTLREDHEGQPQGDLVMKCVGVEREETVVKRSETMPRECSSPLCRPDTPIPSHSQPNTPATPHSQPDTPAPPHSQPDTPAPPHSQPDTPAPPHSQPDTPAPPHSQPDTPTARHSQPDTPTPSHSQPDTPTPSHSQPDTPTPSHSQPDTPSPSHSQPDTPSPSHSQPDTATPPHSQPDTQAASHSRPDKTEAPHSQSGQLDTQAAADSQPDTQAASHSRPDKTEAPHSQSGQLDTQAAPHSQPDTQAASHSQPDKTEAPHSQSDTPVVPHNQPCQPDTPAAPHQYTDPSTEGADNATEIDVTVSTKDSVVGDSQETKKVKRADTTALFGMAMCGQESVRIGEGEEKITLEGTPDEGVVVEGTGYAVSEACAAVSQNANQLLAIGQKVYKQDIREWLQSTNQMLGECHQAVPDIVIEDQSHGETSASCTDPSHRYPVKEDYRSVDEGQNCTNEASCTEVKYGDTNESQNAKDGENVHLKDKKKLESLLCCKFCEKEYDSIVLRRRHEAFFCLQKTTDADIEKSSTEILAVLIREIRQQNVEKRAEMKLMEWNLERVWERRLRGRERRSRSRRTRCSRCQACFANRAEKIKHSRSCVGRKKLCQRRVFDTKVKDKMMLQIKTSKKNAKDRLTKHSECGPRKLLENSKLQFGCRICQKRFNSKATLKVHALKHLCKKFHQKKACIASPSSSQEPVTRSIGENQTTKISKVKAGESRGDVSSRAVRSAVERDLKKYRGKHEPVFKTIDVGAVVLSDKSESEMLKQNENKKQSTDPINKSETQQVAGKPCPKEDSNDIRSKSDSSSMVKYKNCKKLFPWRSDSIRYCIQTAKSENLKKEKKISQRELFLEGRLQFICCMCSKSFSKKSNLKVHALKHLRKNEGSKTVVKKSSPHTVQGVAGKVRDSVKELANSGAHGRTGAPDAGARRDDSDKNNQELSSGKRLHRNKDNDKPGQTIKCCYCGKEFTELEIWKVHMREHTMLKKQNAEKPEKCLNSLKDKAVESDRESARRSKPYSILVALEKEQMKECSQQEACKRRTPDRTSVKRPSRGELKIPTSALGVGASKHSKVSPKISVQGSAVKTCCYCFEQFTDTEAWRDHLIGHSSVHSKLNHQRRQQTASKPVRPQGNQSVAIPTVISNRSGLEGSFGKKSAGGNGVFDGPCSGAEWEDLHTEHSTCPEGKQTAYCGEKQREQMACSEGEHMAYNEGEQTAFCQDEQRTCYDEEATTYQEGGETLYTEFTSHVEDGHVSWTTDGHRDHAHDKHTSYHAKQLAMGVDVAGDHAEYPGRECKEYGEGGHRGFSDTKNQIKHRTRAERNQRPGMSDRPRCMERGGAHYFGRKRRQGDIGKYFSFGSGKGGRQSVGYFQSRNFPCMKPYRREGFRDCGNGVFNCWYCGKNFAEQSQWRSHLRSHSSWVSGQGSKTPGDPPKRLDIKIQGVQNQESGYGGTEDGKGNAQDVNANPQTADVAMCKMSARCGRKSFHSCVVCGRAFQTVFSLYRHMKEHTKSFVNTQVTSTPHG